MNSTLKYILTGTVLLFPCMSGCATNDSKGSPAASAGPVRFEMETFSRKSGDCFEQEDNCATISMTYPVAAEGPDGVASAINDTVSRGLVDAIGIDAGDQSPPPPLGKSADRFLEEYEEYAREAGDHAMGWSVETAGEVAFQNRKLAVLALDSNSFTGGAHPNSYTALFNFDTATGKTLDYKDFVADMDALKEIAERRFKLARELPEDADLAAEGYFWDEGFKLSENFAINKDELRLYYNPYEAAPYAAGPTEVFIPLRELGEAVETAIVYEGL